MARITTTRWKGNSVGPAQPNSVVLQQMKAARNSTLLECSEVNVKVGTFTFRFQTQDQLQETLKFFQQKTRPTSRVSAQELSSHMGEDWRTMRGWDVERWFERLPMNLLKERTRQKIVKALSETLAEMQTGKLRTVGQPTSPKKKRK